MAKFNKEYVYFMWGEELCGRYGYFADSIDTLVDRVTSEYHRYWGKMSSEISNNCAFPLVNEEDGNNYKFFYSDPKWNRVAPHYNRRATNREIAHWLAYGNGEACYFNKVTSTDCFTEFRYHPDYADDLISANSTGSRLMLRKWSDTEWHEPTIDYLGLEE